MVDRNMIIPHNCHSIKNGWITYDHRVMYKKYTAPCPLMGRGAAERRLEWLSQQKHYNVCLGDKGTIGSSFFPR